MFLSTDDLSPCVEIVNRSSLELADNSELVRLLYLKSDGLVKAIIKAWSVSRNCAYKAMSRASSFLAQTKLPEVRSEDTAWRYRSDYSLESTVASDILLSALTFFLNGFWNLISK